jgi:hypothetical protein
MRTPKEMLKGVVGLRGTRARSVPVRRRPAGKYGLMLHLLLICAVAIGFGLATTRQTRSSAKTVVAPQKQAPGLIPRPNPFSVSNIIRAMQALGRPIPPEFQLSRVTPLEAPSRLIDPIDPPPPPPPPPPPSDINNRIYTYLRFDPNQVTGALLQQLEADDSIRILDFPFANGEVYGDELALDEAKAGNLKDGWLYTVMKRTNPLINTLRSTANRTVELNELFLPDEEDTELHLQAYREAGYTIDEVEYLRICLFKRPSGFVRYWDNQFGRLEPVRGMQVWGLVFGIPLHTYTDGNGHYRFPWRFSLGTIMGTHAKNPRVNVKPLNTRGGALQVIPQVIANFIFGSIHIRGWVSSCAMRNDVNFDFFGHSQSRYWSQILNAVWFHDLYSQQQGILSAPTNNLIIYAHWSDGGVFGSASAPMLYHLTGGPLTDTFLGLLFNFTPTSALLSLLHGLLPDITIRVGGDSEPFIYESRLAQTAFHELGHASHFRRVNGDYWWDLIRATMFNGGGPCGGYGCGGQTDDGNVQVAESWAEYIGTQNALTRYPNGQKISQMLGLIRFDQALERETWFFNNWIPTGIYNDLRDTVNTTPEGFDTIGGASVLQLYNVFNSNVDSMCDYQEEFLRQNPGFFRANVESIFGAHNITGCPVTTGGGRHAGMTWTVLQQLPGGVVHVGSDGQTNPYAGDTPPTASLPVLCLLVNNSGVPAGITPDFYNGWARGFVALTPPVLGSQLNSPAAADGLCAGTFGPGWRMAEFHDGRFGANLASIGGWSFWAFGTLPPGTRFWTSINDQPANPWN